MPVFKEYLLILCEMLVLNVTQFGRNTLNKLFCTLEAKSLTKLVGHRERKEVQGFFVVFQ